MTVWEDQYFINGNESGALLIKVIIRESDIDTNAKILNVRNKLTCLDAYLPTIGHDIIKFNIYVKNLVSEIASRGQVTQDLLIHLFKGYAASTDNTFIHYIQQKADQYDEGKAINTNELMQLAAKKYKIDVLVAKLQPFKHRWG